MKLPEPIQTFFDAEQPTGTPPIAAFAPDAIVRDEGQSHAGHAAIETWWRAARDKYQHRAHPLTVAKDNGQVTVRAKVSGDFPGSPAILTFCFLLQGGLIAELEIGA